jgi:putative endonuclease
VGKKQIEDKNQKMTFSYKRLPSSSVLRYAACGSYSATGRNKMKSGIGRRVFRAKRETYRDAGFDTPPSGGYSATGERSSFMSVGFMYILKCSDGSYYTGSTKDIVRRLWEHNNSLGANYTKKRLPVKLVYFEEYSRIDEAFHREKQIQGWSRQKKEALINGENTLLPDLARKVYRESVAE